MTDQFEREVLQRFDRIEEHLQLQGNMLAKLIADSNDDMKEIILNVIGDVIGDKITGV